MRTVFVWSQFVWTPRAEQDNLAEWQRRAVTEASRAMAHAVRAEAVDTASSELESRYGVVAFHYTVGGRVYGAESGIGWLPYATSRFPHVDWTRMETELRGSGRDRLPIEVVYAATAPRIFVVPGYASRPSYYGPGRIFFYVLRTLVLSVCWCGWCLALWAVLAGLAPIEDAGS